MLLTHVDNGEESISWLRNYAVLTTSSHIRVLLKYFSLFTNSITGILTKKDIQILKTN